MCIWHYIQTSGCEPSAVCLCAWFAVAHVHHQSAAPSVKKTKHFPQWSTVLYRPTRWTKFTRMMLRIHRRRYLFSIGANTENKERLGFFNCLHQLSEWRLWDTQVQWVTVEVELLWQQIKNRWLKSLTKIHRCFKMSQNYNTYSSQCSKLKNGHLRLQL